MSRDGKKGGNFRVDAEVRRKFGAAADFAGLKTNQAIEEAMKLFTNKYIKPAKKK